MFLLSAQTARSETLPPEVPVVVAPAVPDTKLVWIRKLEACEDPTGNTTIKILDVNDKYSYGVLQFQMATWLSYGKKFGTTADNIYDKTLQESVARSILDAGGWHNWYNCTKKIGSYPI